MMKIKLICHDQLDRLRYVTKTRQGNDRTDHLGIIYTKNKLNYHDQSDWVRSMMKTK